MNDSTAIIDVPMLHIRFSGRSIDVTLNELDLGPMSSDDTVRTRVADYLEVPASKLGAFAVDRNEATGSMTMRPEAVFG